MAAALGAALAAGFGVAWSRSSAGVSTRSGPLRVVAGEDVWGSIAAQLGGPYVRVTSIVAGPAADPHDFEPTASDARAVADAGLTIANGAGYDGWLHELLSADRGNGRVILTVADVAGVRAGGNPHLWYSPQDVTRVVAAVARDYERLDPAHRRFFERRRAWFERTALGSYRRELAAVRRRFAGAAVGASESVVTPLAHALGLRVLTPAGLLRSVAEGGEPTSGALATARRQIDRHEIAAWIANAQNRTPDVQRLTDAARARGIPVVTITETLAPAGATFQAWQTAELRALAAALERGTNR